VHHGAAAAAADDDTVLTVDRDIFGYQALGMGTGSQ
jgi:hypothetical protein